MLPFPLPKCRKTQKVGFHVWGGENANECQPSDPSRAMVFISIFTKFGWVPTKWISNLVKTLANIFILVIIWKAPNCAIWRRGLRNHQKNGARLQDGAGGHGGQQLQNNAKVDLGMGGLVKDPGLSGFVDQKETQASQMWCNTHPQFPCHHAWKAGALSQAFHLTFMVT